MASFESIPVEVMAMILCNLDPDEVLETVNASRVALGALQAQRMKIYKTSPRNFIHPVAWGPLLAVIRCPIQVELVPEGWKKGKLWFGPRPILKGTMASRGRAITDYLSNFTSGGLNNEDCSTDDLKAIFRFYKAVKPFITHFSSEAIDQIDVVERRPHNDPFDFEVVPLAASFAPLSTAFRHRLEWDEIGRLQRAFFHYELICRVSRPRSNGAPPIHAGPLRKIIHASFPRWQVEEIATVYQYIRAQCLWMAYETNQACIMARPRPIYDDPENPNVGIPQDDLVKPNLHGKIRRLETCDNPDFLKNVEAISTLGLPMIYNLLKKQVDPRSVALQSCTDLVFLQAWRNPALLKIDWLRERRVREAGAAFRRRRRGRHALPQSKPDQWNLGWSLYTRSNTNHDDLRGMGVIFWNSDRLRNILFLSADEHQTVKLAHLRPTFGNTLKLEHMLLIPSPYPTPEEQEGQENSVTGPLDWNLLKSEWDEFEEQWYIHRFRDSRAAKKATVRLLHDIEFLSHPRANDSAAFIR